MYLKKIKMSSKKSKEKNIKKTEKRNLKMVQKI